MKLITVSRQLGSGGGEIAKKVADKLNYSLHDTQSIENAAREMGFLDSVEKIDERKPSFFKRFFSHTPSINRERLNSVIYHLANQGNGVFLGRGGHVLLKEFACAFHVRVIASQDTRIRNLVQKGYTEETALKAMEQSDHERAGFIRFALGKNWNDAGLYDVVLNADKISVDLAAATVAAIGRSEEIGVCSVSALDALARLALTSRAEAALEESGLSYGPSTAVNILVEEPGKVRLSGIVENEKSKTRAEDVIKGVKGVETVVNQIRIRPADRHA
jgi:cytidylate kinase